MKRSQRNNN